jgi:hypothetical protein
MLRDEGDPTSFEFLLEEGLDLEALLIAYRRWPKPHLVAQPRVP